MQIFQNIFDATSALGISKDVVFSTFFTIAIFLLGYCAKATYDRHVDSKHLKHVREFIIAYLESLADPIDKQVEFFLSFSKELGTMQMVDFTYQEDGIRSDFVQSVPQLEVFKALVYGGSRIRQLRIQHLNEVQEALDYIEKIRQLAKRQFIYLTEQYNEFTKLRKDASDSIFRNYDVFISSATRQNALPSQDPFLQALDILVHDWHIDPNRNDQQVIEEKLILSVNKLCRANPADPRAIAILPLTLEASNALRNRNHILEVSSIFFAEEAEKLYKRGVLIKEAGSFFKS